MITVRSLRIAKMLSHGTVKRYVVTHLDKNGMRTLAHPQQGRHTFETASEAEKWILDAFEVNGADRLLSMYGLPLEVRECECYVGHFDPIGVWFD